MFQLSDSKLALMFQGYHEINGIGKSTCQNLCFFFYFLFFFLFSLLACRTRRSRVGAMSENRKKKKKRDTAGHRNPARRTRSGVRHVSDTDTTPKMACPCNLAFRTDAAKMALSWCFIVVVMALLKGATAAQTYEVGDSLGWEVPPNISYYSKWASNKTFYAGDKLCKHFSIPFVNNGSSLIFL